MESTGKYWIPVFNVLENEINIYLTHPKYVKETKRKKTDKKIQNEFAIFSIMISLSFLLSFPKKFDHCEK